jgi:lysophospholipase L1-like esterase
MTSPLDPALTKLASGQSIAIQTIGDSTTAGQWDYATITPANPYGWVGRLANLLGELFDANVDLVPYIPNGSASGSHSYGSTESLRTTSRSGAPTIHVRNGGVGGARFANQSTFISSYGLLSDSSPDIVIIGEGINDIFFGSRGAAFASAMQSFVGTVRSRCPDAPIVITTQNRSLGTSPSSLYDPSFSALTTALTGNPLSLNPPLQLSGTSGVWVLDTRQAYPIASLSSLLNLSDTVGGLHPNGSGYTAQAQFMFEQMVNETLTIETYSLGNPLVGQPFLTTLSASGIGLITWSIQSGQLPTGLTLNASTGSISGTPTSDGLYSFTVAATNRISITLRTYTGSVELLRIPFVGNSTARFSQRLIGGTYYETRHLVKQSGSFMSAVPRS